MALITFSKEEKEEITRRIQLHFSEELDQKLGQFDAEFLLDFFSDEIGPYYYNRGLYAAQSILDDRLDGIKEALYEIEKPTGFKR